MKIKLRGMKMFKKLAVLTALSVLIVAPALAGSCPAKMAAIAAALTDGSAKIYIDKVRSLRAAGEQLHKTSKHSESVKVLFQAMLLAGVSESSYLSKRIQRADRIPSIEPTMELPGAIV